MREDHGDNLDHDAQEGQSDSYEDVSDTNMPIMDQCDITMAHATLNDTALTTSSQPNDLLFPCQQLSSGTGHTYTTADIDPVI